MAHMIRLSPLERRILDRVLQVPGGYEDAEELLTAIGADRNQFVDALETLTDEGCLSVHSLGGNVVIAFGDLIGDTPADVIRADQVGDC